MRSILTLLAAATLTAAGGSALAVTKAEHASHHAAEQAAALDTTKFDATMGRMMEMHQKMQAAKTVEERASLMKEHIASMETSIGHDGRNEGRDVDAGSQEELG